MNRSSAVPNEPTFHDSETGRDMQEGKVLQRIDHETVGPTADVGKKHQNVCAIILMCEGALDRVKLSAIHLIRADLATHFIKLGNT